MIYVNFIEDYGQANDDIQQNKPQKQISGNLKYQKLSPGETHGQMNHDIPNADIQQIREQKKISGKSVYSLFTTYNGVSFKFNSQKDD